MNRDDVRRSPRHAGSVKRYHTWPTLKEQTVADHSFHVLRIYSALYGPPEPEITEYIIAHDLGEIVTGDLPFPVKREHPTLKAVVDDIESNAVLAMGLTWSFITDEQRRQIKICDLLEMWEFAKVEQLMGNGYARPIITDTWNAVTSMWTASDEELIMRYIRKLKI